MNLFDAFLKFVLENNEKKISKKRKTFSIYNSHDILMKTSDPGAKTSSSITDTTNCSITDTFSPEQRHQLLNLYQGIFLSTAENPQKIVNLFLRSPNVISSY